MRLFKSTEEAYFISRPNRFKIVCDLRGQTVEAYLPNPGRLWELLLPRARIYLEDSHNRERKLRWTAVAVERQGQPIMLHTHKTNDIVEILLNQSRIPGLERAEIIKREISLGKSRFDFLLKQGSEDIYLEVKSCTLFSQRVAMFPDAITLRGKRHLEELAELTGRGKSGAVVFVIQWPYAEFFLPEHHTDLDFAQTLLAVKDIIRVIPLTVRWNHDLSLNSEVREIPVPWDIVKKESEDRGAYLLILKVTHDMTTPVGVKRSIFFKKGYYIYAGSAQKNLTQRIERHKRQRKKLFWHIDYLTKVSEFRAALPLRTVNDLECQLAHALKDIAEGEIAHFGASDCSCTSHLFFMSHDPLLSSTFHQFLQYYRMERLISSDLKKGIDENQRKKLSD
jgi:sugar fermentation stimulation protein A